MKLKYKIKTKIVYDRVVVLFMLMAIILNMVVVGVANYVYTNGIMESYRRICSGTSQVIASSVHGNIVNDMLEGKEEEEYSFLKKQVHDTVEQTPNLDRVYICKMQRDAMYVLVDTNDAAVEVGSRVTYPKHLSSLIDTFDEAKEASTFVADNESGHSVMTALVPVFDLRSNCVCYVGCEMDMEKANSSIKEFTTRLATIVSIPTLIIAFVSAVFIQRKVLAPINQLDSYLKKYEQG